MNVYVKGPNDELDYTINWERWIGADTISSSSWAIQGPDALLVVMGSPAASFTATTATAWLDAGTSGKTYIVTNSIVTAAGRKNSRSFKVRIQQQ